MCDDIRHDFDVGYIQGSNLISIRSSHDVSEIWKSTRKGGEVNLWCDGLLGCKSSKPRKKRKDNEIESDSRDEESQKKI